MSGWSKARKIILVVVLVLVFIVGGGFFWAKKQVNNLVSEAENVPRKSVNQAIDEWFNSSDGIAVGEANQEAQGNEEVSSDPEKTEGNSSGNTDGSSQSQNSEPLVMTGIDAQKYEQIKNRYKSKLITLNREYEGRISGLLNSAQAELQSQNNSGSQGTVALAKKYTGAAKALEGECDSKVYAVISDMESELKRNNLPTGIIGQVRTGYEKEKNDRRNFYLGKALKYL